MNYREYAKIRDRLIAAIENEDRDISFLGMGMMIGAYQILKLRPVKGEDDAEIIGTDIEKLIPSFNRTFGVNLEQIMEKPE